MKCGSVTKAKGQTHSDLASGHCVDYTSLGGNNSPSFQGEGENNATKSHRGHAHHIWFKKNNIILSLEKRNHSRKGGEKEKAVNDFPTLCSITHKGLCTKDENATVGERGTPRGERGSSHSSGGCTDPTLAGSQHCCVLTLAIASTQYSHGRQVPLPLASSLCVLRTLCKEDSILFLPESSANHLEP